MDHLEQAWQKGFDITEKSVNQMAEKMWIEAVRLEKDIAQRLRDVELVKPSSEYNSYTDEYYTSKAQGTVFYRKVLRQLYLNMAKSDAPNAIFEECVLIQSNAYKEKSKSGLIIGKSTVIQDLIRNFQKPGTLIWPCPRTWELG